MFDIYSSGTDKVYKEYFSTHKMPDAISRIV